MNLEKNPYFIVLSIYNFLNLSILFIYLFIFV
jgi:hypothetical protein